MQHFLTPHFFKRSFFDLRFFCVALLALSTSGGVAFSQAPAAPATNATTPPAAVAPLQSQPVKSQPVQPSSPAQSAPVQTPAAQPTPAQSQPAPVQPAPAASVPGTPDATDGEYTLRAVVNEVNLIFTVVDKHGHFVRNLNESDFSLLDNRQRPAQVFSFTQQTELPLRVGLLIDASNSIRSRFHFEQDAATAFLLDILRPQVDKAFVMGFDVTPQLEQDYTNNGDLLATGIHKLEPGGGTALYDAVYSACRDKLLPLHETIEIRKAIILVSDGDDNQSHTDLDDAVKMCQRANTLVYAISTNNGPTRDRGDDVLKAMADATGGRAFYPPRMEEVSNAFHAIQEELRSQYSLVYKPANFKNDGSFRPIYLIAVDRHYKVRVQKGYFAPK